MSDPLGVRALGVIDPPVAGLGAGLLPVVVAGIGFGQNPSTFPLPVSDVSGRIKEFTTKRGRSRELERTETGVSGWLMTNQDRSFDPAYLASVYYPNIVPVTPAYIQVIQNGSVYPLFRGDVEEWPQIWAVRENNVGISILDGFDALNSAEVTTSRPVELSGDRINALLDAAEWPAVMRIIDVGRSLMRAKDYANENALSALQDISSSESGNIFMDENGFFVFHDRWHRWTTPYTTIQGQFSNDPTAPELPLSGVTVTTEKARMINDVALSQESGPTLTATDAASKLRYRKRSYSQTVQNYDLNEIQARADFLVQTYKDPTTRVDDITIEPQLDPLLWAHALGRQIGDRIRVEVFPPGVVGGAAVIVDCIIEGIAHKYQVGRWTTVWTTSRALTFDYWILGTSVLGTNTKLGW